MNSQIDWWYSEEFGEVDLNRFRENYPEIKIIKIKKEPKEKDKELIRSKHQEYYKNNKEKIISQVKDYNGKNKESQQIRRKERRLKNKNQINEYSKNWVKEKRDSDKEFRLKLNIRASFNTRFRCRNMTKDRSIFYYTGVSMAEYIDHLKRDPLWSDYENKTYIIHIDHIIPCTIFDFNNLEEIKKCWSPRNLRFLSAQENILKSSKIDLNLILKFGIQDLLPDWIER
jgi:hypothetical protein